MFTSFIVQTASCPKSVIGPKRNFLENNYLINENNTKEYLKNNFLKT